MANDDTQRGLYRKYKIERTDGSSRPGRKHDGCAYFVLDLDHDPFALPALAAYVNACSDEYPSLANDIRGMLAEHARRSKPTDQNAGDVARTLMDAAEDTKP